MVPKPFIASNNFSSVVLKIPPNTQPISIGNRNSKNKAFRIIFFLMPFNCMMAWSFFRFESNIYPQDNVVKSVKIKQVVFAKDTITREFSCFLLFSFTTLLAVEYVVSCDISFFNSDFNFDKNLSALSGLSKLM